MSPNANSAELNDCGCCEGLQAQTPAKVYNRPGLISIARRVGTRGTFKETMLSELSHVDALKDLRTREDSDFTIALIDAWATAADVLTFYQERISCESYLRTATERRSILELARLIGYELRPGVAASAMLAFTIEDPPILPPGTPMPAMPTKVIIDTGTKAQSIPSQDEKPQVFETSEIIEASAKWNAFKPRLTQPQTLSTDMKSVTLQGTSIGLKPGDKLLIVAGEGDRKLKRVLSVNADDEAQTTTVDLEVNPPPPPTFATPYFFPEPAFTGKFDLTDQVVQGMVIGTAWSGVDLAAMAYIQNWPIEELTASIAWASAPKKLADDIGVFVLHQVASIFGYNAPYWDSLPANQRIGEYIWTNNSDGKPASIFAPPAYKDDWEDRTLQMEDKNKNIEIYLDNIYSGIVNNSWLVLEGPTSSGKVQHFYRVLGNEEAQRSDFTINARVTKLQLDRSDGFDKLTIRNTTILGQSEKLNLAEIPIPDLIEHDNIMLKDNDFGLTNGQKIIISGERVDRRGYISSELAEITSTGLGEDGFTIINLTKRLEHSYIRKTVTINANVAFATNGETVKEVLGSGDSSQPYQKFILRQSPLTYTSASSSNGAESTLEVRVNDLLWHEVPAFYGHGQNERIFITHNQDDGTTKVEFGDGVTGARPPTGRDNIQATYRKGIGLAGLVKKGQISLLMNRPLGVKGVTNPFDATGADDREPLDKARLNAPLEILALGRIVSLQDYEDYARAFQGIAKALATWTWFGQVRGVYITIAGPNGAEIKESDPLYGNLISAILKSGDPRIPLRVKSYRKALFRISAAVKVDPDWIEDLVLAEVRDSLISRFSFENRNFGQSVALSEVANSIQRVSGVLAARVKSLYRLGDQISRNSVLLAGMPQAGGESSESAAEMLTLDTNFIDLEVMQ